MLDLMRRHARSWLIKVALGGVIIVFVFWYGWSGPGEKSRGYLAKVNGTVITADQYYRVYDSELEQIRMRFKGAVPPELLEKLDLKRNVAMRLIHRVLLLQEGHRLGLRVTDEELRQDILTNPAFQRYGGFDQGLYGDYLKHIKLTPSAYEDDRRKQMLEEQVARLLTDSVKTDPEEIKRFWHFQNDKLVLSALFVKPEEDKDKAEVDTKDLEAYFKDHQSQYVIPASVDVQYVNFSWRDLEKQMSVTDEDVRSYYHMNPKEFLNPEKLRIRHILLKVPKDAEKEKKEEVLKRGQEILARIKGGEDFAKVAADISEDDATKEKGGDLGLVSRGTLNATLETAAAKLETGQISEPVLDDQGYHILKLEDKQPESQQEFAAVKDKIAKRIKEDLAKKKINSDAESFYEQVYRSEDLETPANKFGFPIRVAESVTKIGGIPELAEEPKIAGEAFGLKPGEVSRMIRTGDQFVILKLIKTTKERIPEFNEVSDLVKKDYVKNQATIKARKKAVEIIEDLKKTSQDPGEIAKRFDLTWDNLDPVSRTAGFVNRLGSSEEVNEMLTTLCESVPLFPSPIPAPGGIAVVRLSGMQAADEAQYAKEAPMVDRWVREVRQTEFLKGWLRLLEKKSEIELDDKML